MDIQEAIHILEHPDEYGPDNWMEWASAVRMAKDALALMQKQEQGLVVVLPDDDMLDIGNALEPIKLHSALRSELLKLELRKAQKPDSVSVLDYTIIAALHDVITRAEAENAIAKD